MSATAIKPACVLNKFTTEEEAVRHAKAWSKEHRAEFTVIHGPSDEGTSFFVEPGDGGMVRSTERLVGHYQNGKLCRD